MLVLGRIIENTSPPKQKGGGEGEIKTAVDNTSLIILNSFIGNRLAP